MTRNAVICSVLVVPFLMLSSFVAQADDHSAFPAQNAPAASSSVQHDGAQTKVLPPTVRLYEGKGLTQDTVCTVAITEAPAYRQYNFKNSECANDEAKSIEFERMPAGTVIELFDEPSCGKNDDWVQFTFFQLVPRTWSSNFETTRDDSDFGDGKGVVYRQVFTRKNGLAGKVSCMIISIPASH